MSLDRRALRGERGTELSLKRTIQLDSVVVATKDQVSCDLKGEAVILNFKNGVYYGLNTVGARIWQALQEPKRVAELRDHPRKPGLGRRAHRGWRALPPRPLSEETGWR